MNELKEGRGDFPMMVGDEISNEEKTRLVLFLVRSSLLFVSCT